MFINRHLLIFLSVCLSLGCVSTQKNGREFNKHRSIIVRNELGDEVNEAKVRVLTLRTRLSLLVLLPPEPFVLTESPIEVINIVNLESFRGLPVSGRSGCFIGPSIESIYSLALLVEDHIVPSGDLMDWLVKGYAHYEQKGTTLVINVKEIISVSDQKKQRNNLRRTFNLGPACSGRIEPGEFIDQISAFLIDSEPNEYRDKPGCPGQD